MYAEQVEESKGRHLALLHILLAQQKAGDETGAMKTAALESFPVNRDNAWATVVAIQASGGNIRGAEQTLARISEHIARANASAHIAVAYAVGGDIPKALQLAAEIPANHAARGNALFRIAAIQAKGGDVPAALQTLKDEWRTNPYGLIPLIQVQLAAGSSDQAVQLTKLTEDPGFKSYLLWAVVMAETNRTRQLNVAATIPVRGVKALAFKDVAERQFAEGDVQGCLSSLKVATQEAPATYNDFARADLQWRIAALFARAHNILDARTVAMAIEKDGHRNAALRQIIDIQASEQDYAGALQTAELGQGDDALTDYALTQIAKRQVLEDLDQALRTIDKIQTAQSRSLAYAIAADTAAEAGNISAAGRLIQTHRIVIETHRQLESSVANEAHTTGESWTLTPAGQLHFFHGAIGNIALFLAKHGAWQEALGYLLLIPEEDPESGRILSWVAFEQAKGGDVDGALRWIKGARLPSQKVFGLVGVANAMLKNKE